MTEARSTLEPRPDLVTDLERAFLLDAGEPCTLLVGEPAVPLSGLAEPRPLATWWPASDVRSVDDADAEGA